MIEHLLNEDVSVYRPSYTADNRGGRTKTFATPFTLRARVMPEPVVREHRIADEMTAELKYTVHVLPSADVLRSDELTCSAGRLRVQAVVSDSSRTYKRLDCQVLQDG